MRKKWLLWDVVVLVVATNEETTDLRAVALNIHSSSE